MRILLPWFSRTGTTRRLAAEARAVLEGLGHEVVEAPIVPRCNLPYPLWLLLSFVPGSRVPVQGESPDPGAFDGCLLALPKWTWACPPVNGYLERVGSRLPPTALLVTCGGWDQDRYLRALQGRLECMGISVRGGWVVKRRELEAETAGPRLERFLAGAFPEPTRGRL